MAEVDDIVRITYGDGRQTYYLWDGKAFVGAPGVFGT